METVIDSLVVKLGLDAASFESGQKKATEDFKKTKAAAEKAGGEIEDSGKKGAEFFGQIRSAALKFFAVLTVGRGMSDFTRSVVAGGAQLSRMSDRLGVSADTLSRWQGAVRQSGGSAEGLLGTMQSLSSSLTELQLTGNTGILPYLQALGVAVADASGKARPLEDILGDIGDKLNAMPDRQNAYNIARNLGIDDGTVNLLMKGRAEVSRLLAEQKAYSDSDAKAAREADEKWEQVKLRIERTTQELVIKLLPSLEKLSESTARFAEVAVPVLSGAIDWFVKLDDATNGWAMTLGVALATLRLIGGPGVIGGIAAMIGSMAKLGATTAAAASSAAGIGKLGMLGKLGAVGAAGAAGWLVGGKIHEQIEGTETENTIGRAIAKMLAAFGNKEAQAALDAEKLANGLQQQGAGKESRGQQLNLPLQGMDESAASAPGAVDQPGRSSKSWGRPGGMQALGVDGDDSGRQAGSPQLKRDKVGTDQYPPADAERRQFRAGAPVEDEVGVRPARAQRNNNPGNLEYRGQQGAVREEGQGRFAKFDTAAEGVAALVRQLKKYAARGLDTVREIIATYAPSHENDTNGYIAALSKKLGVNADTQLNLDHADTLAGLVKGISQQEGGAWLRDQDILSGLQIAGVSAPQQQAQHMSIGEIKVYTQASDAQGIARDIGGALIRQADTGMR